MLCYVMKSILVSEQLCLYLYDLAHIFNAFYEHCPVLTPSPTETSCSLSSSISSPQLSSAGSRSRLNICLITAGNENIFENIIVLMRVAMMSVDAVIDEMMMMCSVDIRTSL